MNIVFDYYSISLLLGGFTALLSGIIVFIHDRKKQENLAWFLLNISSAVWSFGYFSLVTATSKDIAWISNWILHGAAVCIPLFYFLFALSITKTVEKHKGVFLFSTFAGLFFLIVNPSLSFVKDVFSKGPFRFAPDAGPLYIYFTIYFFALVLYALFVVFNKYRTTDDTFEKKRLKYILYFTIAGFGGGGSVFLLTFNILIPPYPIILFSLYPVISGYAIFKYQLFDVKIITTQILTFFLWIFILLRTLLAVGLKEQFINGSLFVFTVIFGILLIRSVTREVKTREKIESLAKDLEKANDRLKELDQLKSEFLSIASHQMRAPITAIKGYTSMLLEGDYGNVDKKIKDPISIVFEASKEMAIMVDDFLNISRIEEGKMKYDFVIADLSKIIEQVINELKSTIEKKGLALQFEYNKLEQYNSNVDVGKIKQAIINIIDNASKYTPRGSITVTLSKEKDSSAHSRIKILVKDTGVGISAEAIPKLFEKFSRAKNAISTNVSGTGLGLYVVKQMIEAHKGKVWVESEGEGKGSTFIIELDEANL
jgi:signal transduction histidine kinase